MNHLSQRVSTELHRIHRLLGVWREPGFWSPTGINSLFPVPWPWASNICSLSFSLFIYKMNYPLLIHPQIFLDHARPWVISRSTRMKLQDVRQGNEHSRNHSKCCHWIRRRWFHCMLQGCPNGTWEVQVKTSLRNLLTPAGSPEGITGVS